MTSDETKGHPGAGYAPAVSPRPAGIIKVLVLAAGGSSRLGRPKQLVRFRGEPLVRRAAGTALALAAARPGRVAPEVLVVAGAAATEVTAALAGLDPVRVLLNPDWATGMAASLRVGVAAATADPACAGLLVTLCDQPLVPPSRLQALVDAFLAAPAQARASRYGGTVGVPAVFPRGDFAALAALEGDAGARGLLRRADVAAAALDVPEAALDVDTAQDLRRLEALESRS